MAASPSSSSCFTDENVIILHSSDKVIFEIDEDVALQMKTIHMYFEDLPLNGRKFSGLLVAGDILAKVIEYCKKHVKNPDKDGKSDYIEELENWDKKFVNRMDQNTLFGVINAADYLYVQPLMDLTCKTVAHRIKDLSVEKIREIFNIKNDFTPEEEAKLRKENQWAFDN
ncbi:SKP1-like protein 14 [Amaranthus tricolor]|uniref:SKP1-like protein 14 n=1 Tax=Amaranthus tricolor TaxID=29722 RepID=UPI0025840DEE|nr:SKP1-like protein 14 [Amaranthus tricolor]